MARQSEECDKFTDLNRTRIEADLKKLGLFDRRQEVIEQLITFIVEEKERSFQCGFQKAEELRARDGSEPEFYPAPPEGNVPVQNSLTDEYYFKGMRARYMGTRKCEERGHIPSNRMRDGKVYCVNCGVEMFVSTEEPTIQTHIDRIHERIPPHDHFCRLCGEKTTHDSNYFSCKQAQIRWELSHMCKARYVEPANLKFPHICWTCPKCGDAWEHQAYLSTCKSFQEHSRLIHQCGVVLGGIK